jgi:pimeloyl-ACP methyl ester carboxylesterase
MHACAARFSGEIGRFVAICFIGLLLGACSATEPLPPWFDSIERIPLRSVEVHGHRIAYLDAGHGPPVILLHGFGGSMWQWEYQQAALAAQARVLTPDVLGSGLSDKPDIAYSPEEMLAFVTGFMDALEIRQAVLVGHSMGAGLAIGMALDHPERVAALVLISGLPPHVEESLTNPTLKRALATRAPAWLVAFGNWLFGGWFTEGVLKELVYDQTMLTPAVLERSHRNRKRPGLFGPLLAAGRNLPLWENGFAPRIGSIRQPTLVIWGEEDRVFRLPVGEALHRRIPGSTFASIPRAGHMPQWEQPDLVNRHLLRVLRP